MVRKVGGFTFQELNLTIDDILATGEPGPDLSYDFVTRPAYHYALITGDTEFLRLDTARGAAARHRPGVPRARPAEPRRAHLRAGALRHQAQGRPLRLRRRGAARARTWPSASARRCGRRITGTAGPYNAVFTQNGIACTTASLVAAQPRDHRPRADRRRPGAAHHRRAPAARHVQRLPAGRVRPVRVGSRRGPAARPVPVRGADPRRRHPMDRARCLRPHGLGAGRLGVAAPACRRLAASTGRCPNSWAIRTSFAIAVVADPRRAAHGTGSPRAACSTFPTSPPRRCWCWSTGWRSGAVQVTVLNFGADRSRGPGAVGPDPGRSGARPHDVRGHRLGRRPRRVHRVAARLRRGGAADRGTRRPEQ